MRHALFALVTLTLLGGCPSTMPGVTCEGPEDCESGICEHNICVDPTRCAAPCVAGEVCEDGACRPSFAGLEIVAPQPDAWVAPEFDVDVRLIRRANAEDAAPAQVELLAEIEAGEAQTLRFDHAGEDHYRGKVAVEPERRVTLTARVPETSLSSGPLSVFASACANRCEAPREECLGGSCTPVMRSIALHSPTSGLHGHRVTVLAKIARTAGTVGPMPGHVLLEALHVETTEVAVVEVPPYPGYDGKYEMQWTPPLEGDWTLKAKLPPEYGELVSEPVSIVVDGKAPEVRLAAHFRARTSTGAFNPVDAQMPETGYVVRDEPMTLVVGSDEEFVEGGIELDVIDQAGQSHHFDAAQLRLVETEIACESRYCQTIELHAGKPELALPGRAGTFRVRATVHDAAGNCGSSDLAAIPVTRFKFMLDAGGTTISVPPALDESGRLFFLVDRTGTSRERQLIRFEPVAKLVVTPALPSRVDQFVVIPASGTELAVPRLLIASDYSTSASLAVLHPGPLGLATQALCATEAIDQILELGIMGDTAVAVVRMGTSERVLFASLDGSACHVSVQDAGFKLTEPRGLATRAGSAFVAFDGGVKVFQLLGGEIWNRPVVGTSGDHGLGPVIGPRGVVAGLNQGNGRSQLVLVPDATTQQLSPFVDDLDPLVGFSAAADGTLFAAAATGAVYRVPAEFTEPQTVETLAHGGTWPTIGARGNVYVVDASGILTAFGPTADWSFDTGSPPASGVAGSPLLDCGRGPSGPIPGAPGVLYLAGSDGKLRAFVVDDPGIEASAPDAQSWPMMGHDPLRTSAAETPLSPFSCP